MPLPVAVGRHSSGESLWRTAGCEFTRPGLIVEAETCLSRAAEWAVAPQGFAGAPKQLHRLRSGLDARRCRQGRTQPVHGAPHRNLRSIYLAICPPRTSCWACTALRNYFFLTLLSSIFWSYDINGGEHVLGALCGGRVFGRARLLLTLRNSFVACI
jgi:hypothetical protein